MLESEFFLPFRIRTFDFMVRTGLVIGASVLYAESHPRVSVFFLHCRQFLRFLVFLWRGRKESD